MTTNRNKWFIPLVLAAFYLATMWYMSTFPSKYYPVLGEWSVTPIYPAVSLLLGFWLKVLAQTRFGWKAMFLYIPFGFAAGAWLWAFFAQPLNYAVEVGTTDVPFAQVSCVIISLVMSLVWVFDLRLPGQTK